MPQSPTQSPLRWFREVSLAGAVLLLGVALSLASWRNARRQAWREGHIQFESQVARIDAQMDATIQARLAPLQGCQGLFDASGEVTGAAWSAYVRRFDVRANHLGLQHIGYAEMVSASEIPAFEARAARLLGSGVRVHPLSDRPRAVPLLYLQPPVKGQGGLRGWDLLDEPTRGAAIREAVRTGGLALTPPLLLRGDTPEENRRHPGLVAYLPIYRKGAAAEAPEAREAEARGVVLASFYADVLLGSLVQARDGLNLRVVDAGAPAGAPALLEPAGPDHGSARFSDVRDHGVGGRVWRATYTPSSAFRTPSAWAGSVILVGGTLVSGVLAALIFSLARRRGEAVRLATRLRQSEDRFRAMAETAPCIIVVYSGLIEYVNPYACRRLGYAPSEILDHPFWSLVHPEDQALVRAAGEARQRGESVPTRYEFRLVARDGEVLWVDFSTGVIRLDGRLLGLGTAFDITDRVRAVDARVSMERKLLETQKLESLGVLAGGLAHDFNNLLGSIMGHASLAEQTVPAGTSAARSLDVIQQACARAAELTRQMLAYSGRGKFVVGPLDLNDTVGGLASLLGVSIPKTVTLERELAAELPAILGDRAQTQQVVMNLITNAAEAIGDRPGTITLRTSQVALGPAELRALTLGTNLLPGPYVCIEVADTGEGMDAATLTRIFDPFFTTKFTGRGLGLAAMQGIVRGHEGGIRVESAPGLGTSFRIYFPALGEEARAAFPEPVNEAPRVHGGLVLVVDDEPDIRALASEALRLEGFEVVEASHGLEALELYATHAGRVRAVVLDLTMPGLSGAEVFQKLKQMEPALPIILSSGYSEQEVLATLHAGGVDGFLQKPYRVNQLLRLVEKLLS